MSKCFQFSIFDVPVYYFLRERRADPDFSHRRAFIKRGAMGSQLFIMECPPPRAPRVSWVLSPPSSECQVGMHFLISMALVYRISATVGHYAPAWNRLGYLGSVNEANDRIRRMCCDPHASVWMALLGACRINGGVELGEEIAKGAFDSNLHNALSLFVINHV